MKLIGLLLIFVGISFAQDTEPEITSKLNLEVQKSVSTEALGNDMVMRSATSAPIMFYGEPVMHVDTSKITKIVSFDNETLWTKPETTKEAENYYAIIDGQRVFLTSIGGSESTWIPMPNGFCANDTCDKIWYVCRLKTDLTKIQMLINDPTCESLNNWEKMKPK